MENKIIDNFYEMIYDFIKTYEEKVNQDFTKEKIDELIRNIPDIISGFKDCTNEEEYRL